MTEASTLFARNCDAFRDRHPAVWARLEAIGEPVSTVVERDGATDNIDLGGGPLYPAPARAWAESQLDEFRRQPERILFGDPSHCNLSPISLRLLDDIRDYFNDRGGSRALEAVPVVDVGYAFVFGIGLGYHVPELVEARPARHLVLIEPIAEFLLHSLSAIDWWRVFEAADAAGLRIHFVLADGPDAIRGETEAIVSMHGNAFLDGSTFWLHYPSWVLQESYKLLRERLKSFYISSGYFEDEVEMVRNCERNIRSHSFRLVESRPHREQTLPVFIVGAGPSLDKDMPHLRALRERVLLVSCGTALGILLKNGIRPDIHCEIERVPLVYDILSALEQEHGFQGITLMATTTVDPRVPGLFDRHWFYYRSGLSPATLLRGSARTLVACDPLVCNAAFAAMATLGFRTIYLFGVDLGQKEAGRHHAKDSVYFREEHADLDQTYRKRFDRTVPGNFGGTVETFWAFDMGRVMLARAQSRHRTELYNCSDGSRIEGARPKVAASIRLPDGLPPRSLVLERLEAQMRRVEAGEILAELDLASHIAGCDTFVEALRHLIDETNQLGLGFFDCEARLHDLVEVRRDDFRGFFAMAKGSVPSLLRLGAFFGTRIRDEAERRAYLAFFLDRYLGCCREMAETAQALLSSIPAACEDAPERAAAVA